MTKTKELPGQGWGRQMSLRTVVHRAMKKKFLAQIECIVESVTRKVVQAEMQRALQLHKQSDRLYINQIQECAARRWQLSFKGKLPCNSEVFTGTNLVSKHEPVQILICNGISNTIKVTGPLLSVKVEIVVLNGDFGDNCERDWTEKDFNDNVVHEREGKGPLLTGDLKITLKNGVGFLSNLVVTDISRWLRSGRFKVGARVVPNSSTEERVQEALSAGFVVKDRRGESQRKHYPPALNDDIWRLKMISKGGSYHRMLTADNLKVNTVGDFLRLMVTDCAGLRNKLHDMPEKDWMVAVNHAKTCRLDDKLYKYSSVVAGCNVGLLFNSIFHLVGVTFDGHNYVSLDTLDPYWKNLVNNLKQDAYRNRNLIVEFYGQPYYGPSLSFPGLEAGSIPGLNRNLHAQNLLCQGVSSMDQNVFVGDQSQLQNLNANLNAHTQMNNFDPRALSDGLHGNIINDDWGFNGSTIPAAGSKHFALDISSQVQTPSSPLCSPIWGQEFQTFWENVLAGPSGPTDFNVLASGKANVKWSMLRAVLRLMIYRKNMCGRRIANGNAAGEIVLDFC